MTPRGRAVAAIALGLLASCRTETPKADAERTVSDRVRGVRYVVPQGWKAFDGEFRSPRGSMMTLRVYDLVEADHRFVAGLPDSLVPQLAEWAKYYYIVDGGPVRSQTTVAGLPAHEFDYPVRVKPKAPPTKVIYWVVRRKTRLFVIRAAFPPAALADEEPVMRDVVSRWGFIDPTSDHEE
jgi:hypothetical protein